MLIFNILNLFSTNITKIINLKFSNLKFLFKEAFYSNSNLYITEFKEMPCMNLKEIDTFKFKISKIEQLELIFDKVNLSKTTSAQNLFTILNSDLKYISDLKFSLFNLIIVLGKETNTFNHQNFKSVLAYFTAFLELKQEASNIIYFGNKRIEIASDDVYEYEMRHLDIIIKLINFFKVISFYKNIINVSGTLIYSDLCPKTQEILQLRFSSDLELFRSVYTCLHDYNQGYLFFLKMQYSFLESDIYDMEMDSIVNSVLNSKVNNELIVAVDTLCSTFVPLFDISVVEDIDRVQPVIEQPVIEQPVIEQPVIEQPVIEQPVIEQPVESFIVEPVNIQLENDITSIFNLSYIDITNSMNIKIVIGLGIFTLLGVSFVLLAGTAKSTITMATIAPIITSQSECCYSLSSIFYYDFYILYLYISLFIFVYSLFYFLKKKRIYLKKYDDI